MTLAAQTEFWAINRQPFHNRASFAQTRTLRIRQMDGLEISTDKLDLAAPDRGDLITESFSYGFAVRRP
jgi:hypothetical protein